MKRAGARSPRGMARALIPLALLMALLGLAWPFTAQAEITVVDYSTAGGDDVSRLTLDKPSGTSAGQLMLAQVTVVEQCTRFLWWCLYDVNEITSPTGWNELRENEGAWNFDNSFLLGKGQRVKQAIYWHIASASEPSTYEWHFDVRGPAAAAITVFDGVDPSRPFDGHSGQGGLGITATAPSIRTTTASTMLVALFGAERGNPDIDLPAGMSELYSFGTQSGPSGIRIAASTEPLTQAGDTGPRVATLAQSQNQASSNVGQLVALRERGTGFDHIRIEHDGQGLTCQPETVTVKACANADCSILYTDPVTTTLLPTGWVGGDTISFTGGMTQAQLSWTKPGTVILDAVNTSPPANRTRCFIGATESCQMVFSDSGFVFEPQDASSACGDELQMTLKAVEKGNSSTLCNEDGGFDGRKTITFRSSYIDPASGTKSILINDKPMTNPITLEFENGTASFTVTYSDVGKIQLNAYYEEKSRNNTLLMTGAGDVVFRPHHFVLEPESIKCADGTANPGALDASGDKFCKAGEDFHVEVKAACSDGQTANNFGQENTPESVKLTQELEAPTGGKEGELTGSFGSFADGKAAGTFQWDEVGIITLTPSIADGDYLGAGDVTGEESGKVGRFYPHHFDTVVTDACTGFSYSGQPFGLMVIAKQKNEIGDEMKDITQNYQYHQSEPDRFAKNVTLSDAISTSEQFTRDLADCTSENPCVKAEDFSEGVANLGVVEGNVTDPKAAKIAFVFEGLKPPSIIQVRANDDDTKGAEGQAEGQTEIRYGRMYAERVHEPLETKPLSLSLIAQYFDGAAFATNEIDSCTAITIENLRLDNNLEQGQTDGTIKVGAGSTTLTLGNAQGLFNGGKLTLNFSAPGRGNSGFVDITPLLDASHANLPWLQYDWNGDGSPENPRGRASWGMYRGNPNVIYMREVWN